MLKEIFNHINDAIYLVDSHTARFLDINDSACSMLGYSRTELLTMSVPDVCTGITDKSMWAQKLREIKEKDYLILKGDQRRKDGSIMPVELNIKYISHEKGDYLTVIARDTTGRKEASVELKRNEEFLKQAQVIARMGSWIWHMKRDHIVWSDNLCTIHDIGHGDFDGQLETVMNFIHPEDVSLVREKTEQLLKDKVPVTFQYRIITGKGKTKHLRGDQRLTIDDQGNIVQMMGILQDITEQIHAEEQMHRQQYYLEKAQEIGLIGTWELDIVKDKLIWTEQNYRNFGVPIGIPLDYETFLSRVHPDDRDYVNAEWMAAINGKPYDIEHRLVVNGRIRWVREKADVTFNNNGDGTYAIGFTQDITERKLMEEEIRKHRDRLNELVSERTVELEKANDKLRKEIKERIRAEAEAAQASHMAALGELAAGVAHEINNPINGVINYSQILLNRSAKGSKDEEIAEKIIKESDRVADIVLNLLSFAHDGREKKSPAQISDIIMSTISLSKTQLKNDGIQLNLSIPPKLNPVNVHKKQIIMVFMNIISNARYALNRKYHNNNGSKSINISVLEKALKKNPYICISVYDNGEGIPAGIKDKILNPFFSTKPTKEGTGLGLSISNSIINDHGGRLIIDSIEGNHTIVTTELPALNDADWYIQEP